jgi:hypothetical protein
VHRTAHDEHLGFDAGLDVAAISDDNLDSVNLALDPALDDHLGRAPELAFDESILADDRGGTCG